MKKSIPLAACLLLGTLIPFAGWRATAEEPPAEDPFGAAEPAAPPPSVKPPAPKAAPEPQETDLIVLTVRSTNPTRADQLIWAARTLLDVGRPEEARKYLRTLLDRKPGAATLAALEREFGVGLFVRFTGEEALRPEGKELGTAVLDAAQKSLRAPQRLDGLIAKLSDSDADARRLALTDLREAGAAGAAALIRVWSDPAKAAEHEVVLKALAAFGQEAEGPLLAALQSPATDVRRQAIEVLGRTKSRAAIGELLQPLLDPTSPSEVRTAAQTAIRQIVGAMPTLSEAQRFLSREIRRGLESRPDSGSENDLTEVWAWDDKQRTSVAVSMGRLAASRWNTLRLAQDLRALTPDSVEAQTLLLMALFEWAGTGAGLDATPPERQESVRATAVACGTAALEEMLAFALDEGSVDACVGALTVLKDIGDAQLLAGGAGEPRTVVRSLRQADPRVRFAAADAIMTWDPPFAFPGSSHLVESLAFFLKTAGTRRALVGHPRSDLGQNLGGMLMEMGFEADVAETGNELVKLAIQNPDYELVLVSDAIDMLAVKDLVQQLRHNSRTAAVPIGIVARGVHLQDLERFAENDWRTRVFPRAQDFAGVTAQVRGLLTLRNRDSITPEQRLDWGKAALDYFGRVAAEPRHYLFPDVFARQDVVVQALFLPPLTASAAHVLGLFGSPEAQRALVSLAGQDDRGLPQRRSAAAAFALAVSRRGLLLSRSEILSQYDSYNRSAKLDKDTQNVLGAVLDAIEAPSQTK